MIKWIFFDLGSTLIDESECVEYRTQELLKQPNAPKRDVRTSHDRACFTKSVAV